MTTQADSKSLRDAEKQAAARAAVQLIESGSVVGLGSGSAASFAIRFLAERVHTGLKVVGIPTSQATKTLAEQLGIQLTTLEESPAIDIDIDGADEIDPHLNLIKGGGGAMLREKVIASASKRFVVVAESTKLVPNLGRFPLPVEVISFAETLVKRRIEALGANVSLRKQENGGLYVTDEGHHILDCQFREIGDPATLNAKLHEIPGVVEHGLFIAMADIAFVGKDGRVVQLKRELP